MEIWKKISKTKGYYFVSNKGQVKSIDRIVIRRGFPLTFPGLMLSQSTDKLGYKRVGLHVDGLFKMRLVHRLVAKAFIRNKLKLREVNHLDCNPSNNDIENLEWITRRGNIQHAIKNGLWHRGEKTGTSVLKKKDILDIRWLRAEGFSQQVLADLWGVCRATIQAIEARKTWTHI